MKLLNKAILAFVVGAGASLLYADALPDGVSKEATTIKLSVEADLDLVTRLQLKAKEDKDLIRLNCINDKMVSLKAELNVADGIFNALMSGGSIEEYRAKAGDIHRIAEDAKGCVDAKRLSTDATNSFSTNGYIPPITGDEGGDHDLESPGYASPDD